MAHSETLNAETLAEDMAAADCDGVEVETSEPGSQLHDVPSSPLKRMAIRVFVLLILVVIAIETSPRTFSLVRPLKRWQWPITKRIGLWQGEWPLFAPNPVLNNAWVSAEVTDPEGQVTMWNSTYWANASSWQKFRNFRSMNYYNQMPFRGKTAAHDFSDFIARELIAPTAEPVAEIDASLADSGQRPWTLELFRSKIDLSRPEDGTLPPRDEILWISSSVRLSKREYLP